MNNEKFFHHSAKLLLQILEPLFSECAITFFTYGKFYKNGKSIVISTHPEAYQYHLNNNIKFVHAFPICQKNNRLIFCPESKDIYGDRYECMKTVFMHDYPIDFVEFNDEHFEFFCYASSRLEGKQSNFYMCQLERLKFQNLYIKNEISNVIKIAEQNFFFQLENLVDDSCFDNCQSYIPEKIRLANTYLKQLYRLTDRESKVLQLHSYGCSAKEISNMLDLSVKTIDSHVRNIKDKVHIEKKSELIKFYLEMIV